MPFVLEDVAVAEAAAAAGSLPRKEVAEGVGAAGFALEAAPPVIGVTGGRFEPVFGGGAAVR